MWGKVFLNQLHTLTSNPCQFSQSLHLHYPITLLPTPQEKKKHTFFFSPSPRGFKRRQRHKLQEIYYCSIWQEPEKQDIYKMNSNVCRETLQVCEDSELRLHLILKKINLYQTYKQLVEKQQAIIVYVFEKLLQRFLFLPFHHIACIKPTVQSTCDVLTGGAASQPYLSSVRFMSRSKA